MTTLELIASRLADLATQIEDLAAERDSYREAAMRLRHELAEARREPRYRQVHIDEFIEEGDEVQLGASWFRCQDLIGQKIWKGVVIRRKIP